MERRPSTCLSVVLLSLLAACAMPGKISSDMQMPAKMPEASRLRSIAVLPFDASRYQDVTPEVEAALSSASVDGRPYFTLVERRRLDDALRELRLADSGAINPATAAKVGQMIAAKGVYMGTIVRDDVVDQPFRESRQVCIEKRLERDRSGAIVEGACTRWTQGEVTCTRRTANFEFVPKLVDVAKSTVVYSRAIATAETRTVCQDEQVPLPLAQDMRRRVRVAAVNLFREDVAPYTKQVDIAYLTTPDGISSQAAKDRFEGSVAFARGQRMDRACEVWQELASAERASPALQFNVGVCAELGGDFARANDAYTSADRLLTRPDNTVTTALRRIRERLAAAPARPPALAPPAAAAPQAAPPTAAATTLPSGVAAPAVRPSAPAAVGSAISTQTPASSASKDRVMQAQTRLNGEGYAVGKPDGVMGARTRAALRRFQSDRKLSPTGELDDATAKALELK